MDNSILAITERFEELRKGMNLTLEQLEEQAIMRYHLAKQPVVQLPAFQ